MTACETSCAMYLGNPCRRTRQRWRLEGSGACQVRRTRITSYLAVRKARISKYSRANPGDLLCLRRLTRSVSGLLNVSFCSLYLRAVGKIQRTYTTRTYSWGMLPITHKIPQCHCTRCRSDFTIFL